MTAECPLTTRPALFTDDASPSSVTEERSPLLAQGPDRSQREWFQVSPKERRELVPQRRPSGAAAIGRPPRPGSPVMALLTCPAARQGWWLGHPFSPWRL